MAGSTASGYPGDTVAVTVQNQALGPANTFWVSTAPVGTTIVAASGVSPGGTIPFGCSVAAGGGSASCGPSGAGGWAAGNVVTLQLAIAPTAAAGTVTGSSSLGGETGSFGVQVLAPPAPGITAPAAGPTLDTAPAVSGTKRAGNSVAVVEGATPVCAVPADSATTWSCTPAAPFPFGSHTLGVTQSSPAGDSSPTSSLTFTVLEPAALALEPGGPATVVPGTTVTRSVTLRNTGPGAAVSPTLSLALSGVAPVECAVAGAVVPCADLAAGVALADLPAGGAVTATVVVAVPSTTPLGTVYPVDATASSAADAASPVAASSTLTVSAPPPPVIGRPVSGTTTTQSRPTVSGTGVPGAVISVRDARGVLCVASVAPDGTWQCRVGPALPFGPAVLVATQQVAGVPSADSAAVSIRVIRPAVVPPPPPPPVEPVTEPAPAPPPEVASLPLSLRLSTPVLRPGTASTFRGELGPNDADEPVTLTLTGTIGKGLAYRFVAAGEDGVCDWTTLSFTCVVTLDPGDSVLLDIRIAADALNAPDRARQQLAVSSSLAAQSTAVTSSFDVAAASTEVAGLAASISGFPGPFLPLLALFLLALAASVVERARRPRREDL